MPAITFSYTDDAGATHPNAYAVVARIILRPRPRGSSAVIEYSIFHNQFMMAQGKAHLAHGALEISGDQYAQYFGDSVWAKNVTPAAQAVQCLLDTVDIFAGGTIS